MKRFSSVATAAADRSRLRRLLPVLLCALACAVFAGDAGAAVAFGDQTVEPSVDSNQSGQAEAFRTTATASGTLTTLTVYVDASATATSLVAGLYADNGSGHPGQLLAQGTKATPAKGAWNDVTVPAAQVVSGQTYWIAILAPSGSLRYRDRCCGAGGTGASETNLAAGLTALPASWTTGSHYNDGPLSAYGSTSAATQPVLAVSPTTLSFSAVQGGTDPPSAQVSVSNAGSGTLTFSASSDASWLTVTPSNGTAPQSLTVSAKVGTLTAATYTGHVTVTATGVQGSPATVTVTFTVGPPGSPGSSADWTMIERGPSRTGDATGETTLDATAARRLALSWSTSLDGKITGQPLFLKAASVSGAVHDALVVGTSANSVYALDANTGAVLWRRNFGAQSGNCAIPGGYGVTGAPLVDRSTNRVYAVSDDGRLRTLSLVDGTDAAPALAVVANPTTNKVWGGLNEFGGSLYIATASDGCDTEPWRGTIYRVDVSGASPANAGSVAIVPGIAAPNGGGGIWGYGGVSIDPATGRVFAATGADSNETYAPNADRMVAFSSTLGLLGSFEPSHPTNFPCAGPPCDVDFGATPVVFQPSGCPTLVAAGNKNGILYLLRADDLAASRAPLQTLQLNPANDWLGSGGVGGTPAYWAAGRMLFVSDVGPGVAGIAGGIVALNVQTDCTLSVAWSATLGGNTQPDSTPTVADGVVYVGEGNGGAVHAYDARTGAVLWTRAGTAGATYAAPMVADGRLFTGSWNGFGSSDAGTVRAYAPSSLAVSITSPAAGSTVSGTVNVAATAAGAVGVQFKLDGANLGAEDTTSPFSTAWDTTAVANGTHTLTAVARDGSGVTVTSASVSVTVSNAAPPPPTKVLLGDQAVENGHDSNPAGAAEAFRTTATATGTVTRVTVYVDASSTSTRLVVGLYSSSASGHPATLLGQGTIASPVRGAWNDVSITSASVVSGQNYWIAVLSPTGTLAYRDRCCGAGGNAPSETNSVAGLTTLPAAWTTGAQYGDAPISAYGSGS
jgi:outer membrane protein assembly factor BamB